MSNTYVSRQIKDNEQRKFQPDSNGNVAVNVIGPQLQEIIDLLTVNGLIWQRVVVTIPSSSSVIVDNNLLNDFSRIKYFLNFKGLTSSSTKGLDLTVQNNAGAVSDTVATRLGGPLDILTNVTDDSVDMFLEIVNNETESVELSFIRNIL